jgi:serine/threonine-protein kinase
MRLIAVCLVLALPFAAHAQDAEVAAKARKVLETNCYRCHGKDGRFDASFGSILDIKKLVERKKINARNPERSRIYAVMTDGIMPPDGETPRPSKADMEIIRRWIVAGANELPEPDDLPEEKRQPITLKDMYQAMLKHLELVDRNGGAQHQRFFTLTHLHNNPKVTDAQMRHYRAGLAKLLNSLSWRKAIVYPRPIDPAGTVLALDLRDLDWDLNQNWGKVIGYSPAKNGHKGYPYALTHDRYPEDAGLNTLAKHVYQLAGTEVPAVRADWFLAAASLPPLYHELLNMPNQVDQLERQLKVNVAYNFHRDRLARAGFVKSNVSTQNRLVERHDALFGMYWKSYDFKGNDGPANLLRYPLGPLNLFAKNKHPYPDQAFVHDGGEMIWALPNGLHAYMLTDGNGERIDAGPTDVVRDPKETAGRGPAIVNGLSCMACHKHGMVELPKDDIRTGAGFQGKPLEKIRRLYPEKKTMDRLLEEDEADYLAAVDRILTPYLRIGPDKNRDIKQFPEVVSSLASPYLRGGIDVEQAALELGLKAEKLKTRIENNGKLANALGLKTWTTGGELKRQLWESVLDIYSPFQEAAAELQLGTPLRIRRLYVD